MVSQHGMPEPGLGGSPFGTPTAAFAPVGHLYHPMLAPASMEAPAKKGPQALTPSLGQRISARGVLGRMVVAGIDPGITTWALGWWRWRARGLLGPASSTGRW